MKLRDVGITLLSNSLNVINLLILYRIKFRDINFPVSFISQVLNVAIFSKSRNLVLAKLSENKVHLKLFIIGRKALDSPG